MPCTPTFTSFSGSVMGTGGVRIEIVMLISFLEAPGSGLQQAQAQAQAQERNAHLNSLRVMGCHVKRLSEREAEPRERTTSYSGSSGVKTPMQPRSSPWFL
eukprot:TRINITY_DN532_c0_g1_i1.p1 TRINITY_DN532_c0_g1~~TRINITY_DN532_c0_g1_i1.p1  ORF type:complete len:101 (-),score=20.63 TRINITY_DN532_c0_g1_i1:149-451(-)